jgi:hypothetical protein
MMRSRLFFLSLPVLLALLFACKKPKSIIPDQPAVVNTDLANGLPSDTKKINGYLFASVNFSSDSYYYSIFSDPGKELAKTYNHRNNTIQFDQQVLGNVDVGSVRQNGYTLSHQNTGQSVIYSEAIYAAPTTVIWTSDGNGSFKPLNVNVARGYPYISPNTYTPGTISKASGFSVDAGNYVSNYDSVIVSLSDNYGSTVTKGYTSASLITFSSSDLSGLNTNSYGSLNIFAYNYSNQTINSKVYLFEQGNKFNKGISITP